MKRVSWQMVKADDKYEANFVQTKKLLSFD